MSAIKRGRGTLENVSWIEVWMPGCEDTAKIEWTKKAVVKRCKSCNACEMGPVKGKVVVGEA